MIRNESLIHMGSYLCNFCDKYISLFLKGSLFAIACRVHVVGARQEATDAQRRDAARHDSEADSKSSQITLDTVDKTLFIR